MESALLELRDKLTDEASVTKGLQEQHLDFEEGATKTEINDPLSHLNEESRKKFVQLQEIRDKLDVALSQRQFDDAVALSELAKGIWRELSSQIQIRIYGENLMNAIDGQIEHLIVMLLADLKNATLNFSESKKIIGYLLKLGLTQKAREMYLLTRSLKIEREIRYKENLKLEYIQCYFLFLKKKAF